MNRSSLSRVGTSLLLAMVVLVFAGSWVAPASAAPGDQPFTYTITARGTETVAVYPDQSFQWTVTTTGTETWAEYNVLLGEWTIEQWGFAESIVKLWSPPANSVIQSWSYKQEDLGWQVAQGWDTGTSIDAGNNRLVIKFFTGGTLLWRGGYRATYRIYGTRYHYDPLSYTQSGSGVVKTPEGDKFISNFSLAAPTAQHGGTVAVNSRTITDTNDRVTTRIDQTAGKVYASTSYSVTTSVSWMRQQTGNATVNTTEGNKLVTTSTLAAPNGDTIWSVTDNNANVDTWMEGNKLYARALSAADKPFNYTVGASGTQTTTTYPDQSFNWTLTTTGMETWVQSDILLNQMEILVWDYAQTHIYYLNAPANAVITRWNYDQHDLGWQYAQGWDGGSYLEGNRLVIKAYTGGSNVWPFIWTGGYWATYRIYGNQYHYDPVSYAQSGSGVVNKTEGNKFIANFSLAAPAAQHGGTVTNISRTITDNNANVTTSMDQTGGKVYASTSYSVSNTQPWSSSQTGSSGVSYAEGDKLILTSSLAAPDGNTTWSVSDDKANVNTWMVGNKLYARALNLQAPVARDDSNLTTAEETPLVVGAPGVLGNDYDPEGDSITAQVASGPAHGSLTLNADGSFQYTPNLNYDGTDSFTYIARDISLQSAPATVSIVVVSVNDLPTISNVTDRTIIEDGTTGAIPFTIGDVETTANSLTLSAATSNPTLVPNANIIFGGSGANRTVTATPAPNENGTTTITVSVTDADEGTVSDNFTLTVTAVNDPPVISNIANQTTNEDTPTAAINFIVGDPETPASDLTLLATSSNPTLVPNGNIVFGGSGGNRLVTITPATNLSGTATIAVTVSDGAASASDSFILTVTAINDLPTIANIASQAINEDEATGTISFTVSDQETPAVSLVVSASSSDPALVPTGSVVFGGSGENRTIKITPASDQNGTGVIAAWVEDADGGKVYTNFVLTVNAVNDAPSFAKGADQAVPEDAGTQTVTGWATAISAGPADESNQTLTFIISNDNNSLFAEQPAIAPSGTLTYRSAPNDKGSALVTVKLKDSGGTDNGGVDTSSTQSFTITVNPVNDAPTVASPIADVTVDEDAPDTTISLTPVFADIDIATNGDSLTYLVTANSNPTLLSASASGGSVTLHYQTNQNGSATITIRATDKGGLWVEDSFKVTVNPVNDRPTAVSKSVATDEETAVSVALSGSDVETPVENLVYTVTDPPAHGALSGTAPNLAYTPNQNYNGTDGFQYTIRDTGDGSSPALTSAPATVSITVNPVNDRPVMSAMAPVAVDEGSSVTIALDTIVSDVETPDSQMNWSATSSNNGVATVSIDAATRVVTIIGIDNGTATVTLTATDRGDPNGASGSAPGYSDPLSTTTTTTVMVSNVAPAPTMAGARVSSPEGTAIALSGSATDPGSVDTTAGFTYSWGVTKNGSAFASGAGASFSFTPDDNASYVVTLTATDKDGGTGTTSKTIGVINVVPTPTITGAPASSPEATTINLSGAATDPGSVDTATGFTYAWSVTKNGNPFASGAVAGFSFTPDDNASYVVTLTATDKDGGTGSTGATITVTNVAPAGVTLSASPATINENETTTVSGSFTDPGTLDSHTVVITWGDGSPDTTINLAANVLSFSASHQYRDNQTNNAPYTVSAKVTDKDDASATGGTTVTVNNVAPAGVTLSASPATINENETTTVSGSLADPGTLDTHTVVITWGDGSPNTVLNLAANVLSFSASHQYLDNKAGNAPYTVSAKVTDKDDASATGVTTVTVNNVAPAGVTLSASPATINENDTTTASGSFTDPGTLDTHTVVITWGDGSPNTVLSLTANVLSFSASHRYLDNQAGNAAYAIGVTVTDKDGAGVTGNTSVTVNNVAPSVGALSSATLFSGQTYTASGSFADPGTIDTWTAKVDYGDGTGELPLALSGKNFALSHTYLALGSYTVKVAVTDDDGGVGTATATMTVNRLQVKIDIKPGSDPNSINLGSKGNVPVGVLTGTYQGVTFDATTIDRGSLLFAGAPDLGIGKSAQDLNGDGKPDMVFHFDTERLNLTASSTQAVLTGKTSGNIYFEASDSVNTVPPGNSQSGGQDKKK